MKKRESLNQYIQYSIRENWNRLALSDFDGISLQYRDVARKISKLHILFEKSGIVPGDRVALCSRNSAHWSVAFLSVITYGAVAVPILHDFHADNIQHLVNHCGARLLFTERGIWDKLDQGGFSELAGVIDVTNYSLLASQSQSLSEARWHLNMLFGDKYPDRFTKEDVVYYQEKPEELAVINYTSGSTGFSKGVMLSYGALWSNLQFCIDGLTFLKPGDGIVCMLPLAHMYGLMIDLLHCFVKGCHIHFLTRLPSPKVILGAFAQVKPKLVVAVPLVVEKIIRNNVFPKINKPMMKLLLSLPVIKNKVLAKVYDGIIGAFGGNLMQLIIGGASLSPEVEQFLRKIKFPFTVGYGMTECGPLIAYAPWDVQKPQSCGRIVDRMECRIESQDPVNVPGVLWVRGSNVMQGYYKNPEATEAVFKDGWMSTGDICTMDTDGFIFIRGRDKTMILGSSGQNIYPEEIEGVLNHLPYVGESLVVQQDGKLVALIYPDMENEEVKGMSSEKLSKLMDENITVLNARIPAYSKVSGHRIMDKEFEKTPKRSIKRYLYQSGS